MFGKELLRMGIRVQKRHKRYFRAKLRFVRGIFIKNFIAFIAFGFLIVSVFGSFKIYKLMRTSDYFSIKRINVYGAKNSYAEDIIGLSGISIGDNIFSFSSDKAAEQIKMHPWVKKVIVKKHLPDGVSIEIVEYNPVMFINFSQLYLVDENAVVFKRLEPNELFDFPIISGISKEDYQNAPEYYSQKILDVFDLVKRFERRFPNISISEVVLEKDGDVTLILAKNTFEIRLGQGNYDKKLTILEMILSEAKNRDISPEIVYLDVNRDGIFTMRTKQKR